MRKLIKENIGLKQNKGVHQQKLKKNEEQVDQAKSILSMLKTDIENKSYIKIDKPISDNHEEQDRHTQKSDQKKKNCCDIFAKEQNQKLLKLVSNIELENSKLRDENKLISNKLERSEDKNVYLHCKLEECVDKSSVNDKNYLNNQKILTIKKNFDDLTKKFEELVVENVNQKKQALVTDEKLRVSCGVNRARQSYSNNPNQFMSYSHPNLHEQTSPNIANNGVYNTADFDHNQHNSFNNEILRGLGGVSCYGNVSYNNNKILEDSYLSNQNCGGPYNPSQLNASINTTQYKMIIPKLEERLAKIESTNDERLLHQEKFSEKFKEQFTNACENVSGKSKFFKNLLKSSNEDQFIIKNTEHNKSINNRVYNIIMNINVVPEFKKIILSLFEELFSEKIQTFFKKYENNLLVKDSKLQSLEKLTKLLMLTIKKNKKFNIMEDITTTMGNSVNHTTFMPNRISQHQKNSKSQASFNLNLRKVNGNNQENMPVSANQKPYANNHNSRDKSIIRDGLYDYNRLNQMTNGRGLFSSAANKDENWLLSPNLPENVENSDMCNYTNCPGENSDENDRYCPNITEFNFGNNHNTDDRDCRKEDDIRSKSVFFNQKQNTPKSEKDKYVGMNAEKIEGCLNNSVDNLQKLLIGLQRFDEKVSKQKDPFMNKINEFMHSANYQSMEKELKGKMDILCFNLDKVQQELKTQSKEIQKVDIHMVIFF